MQPVRLATSLSPRRNWALCSPLASPVLSSSGWVQVPEMRADENGERMLKNRGRLGARAEVGTHEVALAWGHVPLPFFLAGVEHDVSCRPPWGLGYPWQTVQELGCSDSTEDRRAPECLQKLPLSEREGVRKGGEHGDSYSFKPT